MLDSLQALSLLRPAFLIKHLKLAVPFQTGALKAFGTLFDPVLFESLTFAAKINRHRQILQA